MLKLTFSIIIIFLHSCLNCQTYADEFRKKQYFFQVERKYIRNGRCYTLTGNGINNRPDTFSESGYSDLYNGTQVGDTLRKEFNKTQVVLIKKDTTLIFSYSCDGRVIK